MLQVWKKFEPLWDFIIRVRQVTNMLPLLEAILEEFGHDNPGRASLEDQQYAQS